MPQSAWELRSLSDELVMNETYPRTSIWPFVTLGLLVFGLVLAPPHEWPRTVRELHVWAKQVVDVSTDQPKSADKMLVEYDPTKSIQVRMARELSTQPASHSDLKRYQVAEYKPPVASHPTWGG